jgi:hypothetical protein
VARLAINEDFVPVGHVFAFLALAHA